VQTAGAGLQVESTVRAYLDSPGQGLAEGTHELYRKQSVPVDLASVCGELRKQVADLIAFDDPQPAAGFLRGSDPLISRSAPVDLIGPGQATLTRYIPPAWPRPGPG
jgi:hypothetical protein